MTILLQEEKGISLAFLQLKRFLSYVSIHLSLKNLNLVGLACHIGSQILDLDGYIKSADKIFELSDQLSQEGIELDFLDLGGGLGVTYEDEVSTCTQGTYFIFRKKI